MRTKLTHALVLVHIPRCAGTSVTSAIRSACGLSNLGRIAPHRVRKAAEVVLGTENPQDFFNLLPLLQQYLLSYLLMDSPTFLSGHFPVGDALLRQFSSTHRFVTILRDPVERWISHYIYNKLVNADPLVPPTNDRTTDLLQELNGILKSHRGWQLGHLITTFLSGKSVPESDSADAVDIAQENLRRFTLIGFIDELDDFCEKFSECFAVRLRLPHQNSAALVPDAPHDLRILRKMFTDDIRARIARLCEGDYRVYETAREIFGASL